MLNWPMGQMMPPTLMLLKKALLRPCRTSKLILRSTWPEQTHRFGRLALTKKGLEERDRIVFQSCLEAGLPIAVTMAGGYAPNVQDTVDMHFQTVLSALELQNL